MFMFLALSTLISDFLTYNPVCHFNRKFGNQISLNSLHGIFHTFVSKQSFKNTIRVSKSLDQGQNRHSVCLDLTPSCLQKLSAGDKSSRLQGKS